MSVIFYEHTNFRGAHKHIVGRDETNLHSDGWGDRVSAIQVLDGAWQCFQHINFAGNVRTLGPGSYSSASGAGIANDSLSSVRRVPGAAVGLRGLQGVVLYEHVNFRGDHKHIVNRDEANLHSDGWGDRVSSIQVLSGRWRFYEHTNFGGWSVVLEPGLYPDARAVGIGNDTMSSVQRVAPQWDVTPLPSRETILYQHVNFGGNHRHLINQGEPNLHVDGWGDTVSSVQVVSGTRWTFHLHINYSGNTINLGPGSYPNISAQGLPNDSLSSVRANLLPVFFVTVNGATTNLNRDLNSANNVYNQYGIEMFDLGRITVPAPTLLDLAQPTCNTIPQTAPTGEETSLYTIGRDRFPANMIAYYVRSTTLGVRGCAAYPANRPGAVVTDGATQWTLAHEIGHVLGLAHRNNTTHLMNNGTAAITANPPILTNADQNTVDASVFLV
jgi:hypothetical protein